MCISIITWFGFKFLVNFVTTIIYSLNNPSTVLVIQYT